MPSISPAQEAKQADQETPEGDVDKELLRLMPGFLLAVVIVSLMAAQMGLVFLTNWRDALGRMYVYRTICTTVSIFCAVLINRTVFDLVLVSFFSCVLDMRNLGTFEVQSQRRVQLQPNVSSSSKDLTEKEIDLLHPCGEASYEMEIAVAWFFCVFWLYVLNVAMAWFRWRDAPRLKFVIASIGGHLVGFAGIESFGNWYYHFFAAAKNPWIPALSAFIGFFIARFFTGYCRSRVVNRDKSKARHAAYSRLEDFNGQQGGLESDAVGEWSVLVREAEDDANALCLGFLAVQLLCRLLTNKNLPVEDDKTMMVQNHRDNFFFWYKCCLAALIMLIFFRSVFEERFRCKGTIHWIFEGTDRVIDNAQSFLGMVFAWSMFKHGDWFWRQMFYDVLQGDQWASHSNSPPTAILLIARAVNAMALTILCAFLLVVLVSVGEFFELYECHFCRRQIQLSNHASVVEMYTELKTEVNKSIKARRREESPAIGNEELTVTLNNSAIKAIRQVTGVLGFVVGICWERTYSQANAVFTESIMKLIDLAPLKLLSLEHHIVGRTMTLLAGHPVCVSGGSTVVLVGLVCTVWWKYLVRYAQLDHAHHLYLLISQAYFRDCVSRPMTQQDVSSLGEIIQDIIQDRHDMPRVPPAATPTENTPSSPEHRASGAFPSMYFQCCSRVGASPSLSQVQTD